MKRGVARPGKTFGASFKTVRLDSYFNWPPGRLQGEWWRDLAKHVRHYPRGNQKSWGIPFKMAEGNGCRTILAACSTFS